MSRTIKWLLFGIAALAVIGYMGFRHLQSQTKMASPEAVAAFTQNELHLEVRYCRPYKKDREIFGGLVPYGEVWRTGANEATTFTSNKDFNFGGTAVKAGTYTLWTVPGPDNWTVILNEKRYGWGVGWGGVASREAGHDAASVTVPVAKLEGSLEQFTIRFDQEPPALVLEWDDVMVAVPITQ